MSDDSKTMTGVMAIKDGHISVFAGKDGEKMLDERMRRSFENAGFDVIPVLITPIEEDKQR